MALGGLVLGSLILQSKGMRIVTFQLSGFYCRFLRGPTFVRAAFLLLFRFNKGTLYRTKRAKGNYSGT